MTVVMLSSALDSDSLDLFLSPRSALIVPIIISERWRAPVVATPLSVDHLLRSPYRLGVGGRSESRNDLPPANHAAIVCFDLSRRPRLELRVVEPWLRRVVGGAAPLLLVPPWIVVMRVMVVRGCLRPLASEDPAPGLVLLLARWKLAPIVVITAFILVCRLDCVRPVSASSRHETATC